MDAIDQEKSELIFIGKDIRRARKTVEEVYYSKKEEDGYDLVDFDLSAIHGIHMPGVSAISAADGFTLEEAFRLVQKASKDLKKGGVLVFSEYNPTIDKFKSGTLLHDLLLEALFALS